MRFWLTLFAIFTFAGPALALETDQFTVPPSPLVDLGPAMDAKVVATLQQTVDHANTVRADELAAVAETSSHYWQRVHARRADEAIELPAIADDFYDRIASWTVPRCKIEHWVEDEPSHASSLQPMPVGSSIYGGNMLYRPLLMVELSPTVLLHGQYTGVDKTGHFFQQGHEYYNIYLESRLAGKSEHDAIADAVAHGVAEEHGWYGEAIVGVYSNGDLSANFTGLLFYRNLMEPMQVGPAVLSPMILRTGDQLSLSPRLKQTVCAPFVTEHWNEAYNPCHYVGWWRNHVRDRIASRLEAWMAFNHTTPAEETLRLKRVETFYGQDYGHSPWTDVITAANVQAPAAVAAR